MEFSAAHMPALMSHHVNMLILAIVIGTVPRAFDIPRSFFEQLRVMYTFNSGLMQTEFFAKYMRESSEGVGRGMMLTYLEYMEMGFSNALKPLLDQVALVRHLEPLFRPIILTDLSLNFP
jgi:hypothetical protein